MTRLAGVQSFQWSSIEQVYPLERGPNNETLYAIQVDNVAMPNGGWAYTAHNIAGLYVAKIHQATAFTNQGISLPRATPNYPYCIDFQIGDTQIQIQSDRNYSSYSAKVRLIYAK
jgi:hypothetical protein